MTYIRCQNCGGEDFEPTTLGEIVATEGHFSVNAYACQNCGHIELFEPSLDLYSKHLREKANEERKQQELQKERLKEAREARIAELIEITKDENSTLRQVREAKEELKRLNYGVISPFY